jgi:quinol monooxygenase YgiN
MDDNQITIVCFIKAKEQKRQQVMKQLINLTQMTRKEPGNINYNLHIAKDDDHTFIIYENWKDQSALDYHMNQPYLKDFLQKEQELLEVPIDGTICKKIE